MRGPKKYGPSAMVSVLQLIFVTHPHVLDVGAVVVRLQASMNINIYQRSGIYIIDYEVQLLGPSWRYLHLSTTPQIYIHK